MIISDNTCLSHRKVKLVKTWLSNSSPHYSLAIISPVVLHHISYSYPNQTRGIENWARWRTTKRRIKPLGIIAYRNRFPRARLREQTMGQQINRCKRILFSHSKKRQRGNHDNGSPVIAGPIKRSRELARADDKKRERESLCASYIYMRRLSSLFPIDKGPGSRERETQWWRVI